MVGSLDEEAQEDLRANKNFNTYKGALYENVIADMLVKQGYKLYYYKNKKGTLEMDFFVRSADCLVPVEVKAENNRSKSLRTMIDREIYKDIRWGVKLVNGNVGFENGILTLPQWCAFKIPEIVREFKP